MRLSLTKEEAETRLAEVKARLDKGGYPGADSYYDDKDLYWELLAHIKGSTYAKVNPMGYWYGRQSN